MGSCESAAGILAGILAGVVAGVVVGVVDAASCPGGSFALTIGGIYLQWRRLPVQRRYPYIADRLVCTPGSTHDQRREVHPGLLIAAHGLTHEPEAPVARDLREYRGH